jgi:hypothetical protein
MDMWKLRMCIVGTVAALALVPGTAALASSGGNSNAGDVWLDNAGQPAGPGHEMDPHLACGPINLYGSGLADNGGSFTIDSWPPSGQQVGVYTANWSYDTSREGTQQIADTIDGRTLVQDAISAGASASNQGYHFKLDFSQDPQKHKTFWINCQPSSQNTGGGSTTSNYAAANSGGTCQGTMSGQTSPSGTCTHTTVGSSPATAGNASTTTATVKGVHKSRRRHHSAKKARKLVRPKRHVAPKKRSMSATSTAAPAFTG